MLNLKTTFIAATATLIAGTVAFSTFADFGGRGHGGKGKNRIERMCGADAQTGMKERAAEIQAALNLSPEQQALFNQLQAARAETAAGVCGKIAGKEMTRALRKEIRGDMREARKAGRPAAEAFRDSLSDEQKTAMKELRKGRKGRKGKRGHKKDR